MTKSCTHLFRFGLAVLLLGCWTAPVTADDGQTTAASLSPEIGYHVLIYDATVAGAAAGTATIALRRDAEGYRIVGQAKAQGLLDAISPWRSHFKAHGDWLDGRPQPRQFHYQERGRDKRRDVLVSEGTLQVNKNGKQRPTRKALPGWDVLTVLFAYGKCQDSMELHTGRHGYRLIARSPASENNASDNGDQVCRYQVTDEDDDSFATKISFAIDQHGQRVPRRIEVSGGLSGVLRLRESRALTGRCELMAAAPLDYLCGDSMETVALSQP